MWKSWGCQRRGQYRDEKLEIKLARIKLLVASQFFPTSEREYKTKAKRVGHWVLERLGDRSVQTKEITGWIEDSQIVE